MLEDGAVDAPERDAELPFALLDSNGEACQIAVLRCEGNASTTHITCGLPSGI
jgi:hypothetical protein